MNKFIRSLYAFFVGIALLTSCSSSWDTYQYEKASFTVDFPGKPRVKSGFERTSQSSSLTTTTYTATQFLSDESYLVYIGNFNSWSMNSVIFNLESGKQGMREPIKQQRGSVVSEGPAELAGQNAWEFKIRVKELEGTLRVFVKNKTIYGLQELHNVDEEVSSNTERFLSSFRLLEE